MHEMALAESVLLAAQGAAQREGFARVKAVRLEIGVFAGVEPEALAFCFDAVTRGSLAEGARLEIERTPGSGWCMACGRSVPLEEEPGTCPECGGHQVQVTGGTAMRIRELAVE